jgi:hypothetical protein
VPSVQRRILPLGISHGWIRNAVKAVGPSRRGGYPGEWPSSGGSPYTAPSKSLQGGRSRAAPRNGVPAGCWGSIDLPSAERLVLGGTRCPTFGAGRGAALAWQGQRRPDQSCRAGRGRPDRNAHCRPLHACDRRLGRLRLRLAPLRRGSLARLQSFRCWRLRHTASYEPPLLPARSRSPVCQPCSWCSSPAAPGRWTCICTFLPLSPCFGLV